MAYNLNLLADNDFEDRRGQYSYDRRKNSETSAYANCRRKNQDRRQAQSFTTANNQPWWLKVKY